MCDHEDCEKARQGIRKAMRATAVRNVTMKTKADLALAGIPVPTGPLDAEWFDAGIQAGVQNTLALLDANTLFDGAEL